MRDRNRLAKRISAAVGTQISPATVLAVLDAAETVAAEVDEPGTPPAAIITDGAGRTLVEIKPDGTVDGSIDQAGDAGRVFFRAIKNALADHLWERDRPVRAAAIEDAHARLLRERRHHGKDSEKGLIVASAILRDLHPEKEWRMRH